MPKHPIGLVEYMDRKKLHTTAVLHLLVKIWEHVEFETPRSAVIIPAPRHSLAQQVRGRIRWQFLRHYRNVLNTLGTAQSMISYSTVEKATFRAVYGRHYKFELQFSQPYNRQTLSTGSIHCNSFAVKIKLGAFFLKRQIERPQTAVQIYNTFVLRYDFFIHSLLHFVFWNIYKISAWTYKTCL